MLLAGCGPRVAAPVRHGVVTLSPALTETVFALGKGSELIGDTTACDYPPEAKKLPKLLDLHANIEELVRANPALILADLTVNGSDEVQRLRSLGLRVEAFKPTSIAKTAEMIRAIGKLLHADARATRLAAALDVPPVTRSPAPRVLFTLGTDGLYVAGSHSLTGDCVRRAGGANVAADTVNFYQANREALVLSDPQVIFTTGPVEDFLKDPSWRGCTALRTRAVFQVPSSIFSRSGPRLAEAVAMLNGLLDKAFPGSRR
jgi:iron complex transport system substrate-binding protein